MNTDKQSMTTKEKFELAILALVVVVTFVVLIALLSSVPPSYEQAHKELLVSNPECAGHTEIVEEERAELSGRFWHYETDHYLVCEVAGISIEIIDPDKQRQISIPSW